MPRPRLRVSALLLGALLGAATLLQGGTAEAGRARFSGSARLGGHWHHGGRVSVRYARPVWRPRVWVGGSVWIGSRYYYPRSYYYYPEYVPSYYAGASYYPVQPVAAPSTVAAVPARPALPRVGIGVFAGGSSVEDRNESSDLGAMLRLRLTPGLLIEGELGKTSFEDDVRVDRRIGASLIYEIGAYNTFAPYLLGGGGVQQSEVDGSFTTTQNFGEIGIGLRWALSRNLHVAFDIRAGRRQTIESDGDIVYLSSTARSIVAPPETDATEDYSRGRLAAILYF